MITSRLLSLAIPLLSAARDSLLPILKVISHFYKIGGNISLKREYPVNSTYSAVKQNASHFPLRSSLEGFSSKDVLSSSSAFDVVEPELVEALSRVSEQLNVLVEQSLNDATPAKALVEKLSLQLDEVAGVFTLLDLPVAASLSLQLAQAVEQVYAAESDDQQVVNPRQYDALFQCVLVSSIFYQNRIM